MESDRKGKVNIGENVPAFSVVNEKGEIITQESLKGSKHILFFYGQDDTPTCTKEACNIRDNYKEFLAKGFKILGVSKDNVIKHQKFIAKYNLPFSLLADTDLTMMHAFGYHGPKKFMGKIVNGVYRTTVVTDEQGIITHIIDDVVSGDHSNQIKRALGI